MILFDSHCHFDFADFDNDRDSVWRNCQENGVRHLVIPGVSPAQWSSAAKFANQYAGIYCAAGLHPWWIAREFNSNHLGVDLQTLKRQLISQIEEKNCVAIGECGLDALIDCPIAEQLQVFEVHLQVAQETKMPLIIHCRKSHNGVLQWLKSYRLPAGGVIHGFSGSYELAKQYWSLGFRLGIGGTITYERANKTREAVRQLPLDAILLETDAPDMPLHGKQGERNSPVYLVQVANELASLRGDDLAHIAKQTTLNAQSLFKINF
ncbi:TatD family hydrolase [Cellvibrio sp.]|uniref:TatD family hydrolase n=1 Tax=Cellvibrio sp. TaxID=1965322 RepID=UPI0039647DDF